MCAGAQRKRRAAAAAAVAAASRQRRQAAGAGEEEEEDVEAEFNPENPYQVSHISDAGVTRSQRSGRVVTADLSECVGVFFFLSKAFL